MSKSLGNIIDPWSILDTRGADAMRWWMFSQGSPWTPTRATLSAIDTAMRDMLLTLWNTYSFFTTYASLNEFDVADAAIPAAAERGPLDRWILSRLASTTSAVTEALETYEPLAAATGLADLVDDLSNWYVRRSRRRFWRTDPDAPAGDTLAAQATLHTVLTTLSLLLAPLCPFVADAMWRDLTGAGDGESVHLADWPVADVAPRGYGARGADGAGPPAHVAGPGRPERGLGQGAPAPAAGAGVPAGRFARDPARHCGGRAQRRRDRHRRRAERGHSVRAQAELPDAGRPPEGPGPGGPAGPGRARRRAAAAALEEGRSITVVLGGEEVELTPDDVRAAGPGPAGLRRVTRGR